VGGQKGGEPIKLFCSDHITHSSGKGGDEMKAEMVGRDQESIPNVGWNFESPLKKMYFRWGGWGINGEGGLGVF